VPLLAPGYFALALLLRERPLWLGDFLILSFAGMVWGVAAWIDGPWQKPSLLLLWITLGCGKLSWLSYRLWFVRPSQMIVPGQAMENHLKTNFMGAENVVRQEVMARTDVRRSQAERAA
jgi:hypothetical protein